MPKVKPAVIRDDWTPREIQPHDQVRKRKESPKPNSKKGIPERIVCLAVAAAKAIEELRGSESNLAVASERLTETQ